MMMDSKKMVIILDTVQTQYLGQRTYFRQQMDDQPLHFSLNWSSDLFLLTSSMQDGPLEPPDGS
jgi:hypothetical protein